MPSKEFQLDDRLSVKVTKRRSSRHLRLTISARGEVKVSIPAWAPYKVGLDFANSRRQWIEQQARPKLLIHNQAIGKAHHLQFLAADVSAPRSHIQQSAVNVYYPARLNWQHPLVQRQAESASIRALRRQAEALLPARLDKLASQHGLSYNRATIKQLKSRWGSCDSQNNITLNLFLVQLPWDLIDYVLLHELTHTQVMRHGPDFWRTLEEVLPRAKQLRKQLHNYQPVVQPSLSMA